MKNWRRKNRKYSMWHQAKYRSKRDSIPFELTVDDIPETPDVCPILGIPLVVHEGHSGFHNDSPSLDRIYNNKGYVKDNIRIISNRANRLKLDASVEELEKILEDARCHRY